MVQANERMEEYVGIFGCFEPWCDGSLLLMILLFLKPHLAPSETTMLAVSLSDVYVFETVCDNDKRHLTTTKDICFTISLRGTSKYLLLIDNLV